jgi:hypothetical protein
MPREAEIMIRIQEAVNASGMARLIRNSVGFDLTKRVRYGLGNGSPDLVGVLRSGRAVAIEVKTPVGRLSVEQKAWIKAAEKWNVAACVARSVEEAMEWICKL